MRSVFTAPAAAARADSVSASACASSLNGTVTFAPRPPSATNARTAASNPSIGASRCVYSIGSPVCAANCAWMNGDLLCATGLPNTT